MQTRPNHDQLIEKGLRRVTDVAELLQISRSTVYNLMNRGLLPSIKIGRSRRIPLRAVIDFASLRLQGSVKLSPMNDED